MKKASRFLFVLLLLVVCFQFLGLEEAVCDDSILETNCQECVTCVLHQFIGLHRPVSTAAHPIISNAFSQESALQIEEPSFRFFRPPISR